MASRHATGALGEELAVRHLETRGLLILERNVRLPHGEIDIVASDHGVVVFVEVKTRHHRGQGDPLESVTPAKARMMANAARQYLARSHRPEETDVRFDLISILCDEIEQPQIEWIPDAFHLDEI